MLACDEDEKALVMSCEATEKDMWALRILHVVHLAAIIAASRLLSGMQPQANDGSLARLSLAFFQMPL